MGFFSAVKKFFTGKSDEKTGAKSRPEERDEQLERVQGRLEGGEQKDLVEDTSNSLSRLEQNTANTEGLSQPKQITQNEKIVSLSEQKKPMEKDDSQSEEHSANGERDSDRRAELSPSGREVVTERNTFESAMVLALRKAEPRLSAWLAIVLDGVEKADELLWNRLAFLLRVLETPESESEKFIGDFRSWLERMEYEWLEDFRSELQYRLALALDMEDEEDERDRLFSKLKDGLAKTSRRLGQGLALLAAGHSDLDAAFWEEMEELFIMADMGAELSLALVKKIKSRALEEGVKTPDALMPIMEREIEAVFKTPRRIAEIPKPEVVLMVGVNGVGKTTTIAKLAYRAQMQGKKVLIAAADTFRAAAVEQLEVWARRLTAGFHSKGMGADPAAVAFESVDIALRDGYDVLFIDTAGRLHTKSNLMEELHKIRKVVERKCPGAPHRTVLVIDATTGQNALQQTKAFKESSGVNEIILTKLDGTAKGGVALAVAGQFGVPITFVGLGEKMEDLRPFDAHSFARALLEHSD